ncbi:hypothetical protein [Pararhodobacter sp. CCB-MM2]|uniref:hypothetical protein n=1 Tax=Pararhodobacter sp. CCB-MM2 TaxID=1786003 RepID=UPI00082FA340|nr:hypothetical protein [Pararhodobacter sp. CCB-MM2]
MNWRDITGAAKAAAILALLSVIVSFTSLSTSSMNGVRTCSFVDYGAIAFGGLAILFGAIALAKPGEGEAAGINRMAGGLALLVGLWRLGYGLGFIGGPCG